jgi:hypothetical protein
VAIAQLILKMSEAGFFILSNNDNGFWFLHYTLLMSTTAFKNKKQRPFAVFFIAILFFLFLLW